MKILVTGASGFVGSRTCAYLEKAGHEVLRVSHVKTPRVRNPNEWLIDIADPAAFETLNFVGDIDVIVHCAGIAHRFGKTSKEEFWRVNVDGAKNVATFAARNGVGRFIHLSSVLVYGTPRSSRPVTEKQKTDPQDDYASSKLAGEMTVAEVCESAGIGFAILRPVPIIGEGSRGNVARLIRAIDRRRFVWIGDGRNERSFVYVDDVAAAIGAALSLTGERAVLNVTGGEITVRELVDNISKQLGVSRSFSLLSYNSADFAMRTFRPLSRVPGFDRYYRTIETWLADAVYSGDSFRSLGFRPMTGVKEGLTREVKSYLTSKP
jgi:nucleoside-diphosphate-sugar epimerase